MTKTARCVSGSLMQELSMLISTAGYSLKSTISFCVSCRLLQPQPGVNSLSGSEPLQCMHLQYLYPSSLSSKLYRKKRFASLQSSMRRLMGCAASPNSRILACVVAAGSTFSVAH
eukprot:scaffold655_cov379-Prasinococcus_capsulatus_cf.AAC.9